MDYNPQLSVQDKIVKFLKSELNEKGYDLSLIKDTCKYIQKINKQWRYGQTVFIVMYDIYPNIVCKLVGTNKDCFYIDALVDDFLNEIYMMM